VVDIDLIDHIVELCVGGIEPEGFHDGAEFGSGDDAYLKGVY
jgi:hypothetical protein